MDYKKMSEELLAFSQKCNIPIFTIDEELMTAIYMRELKINKDESNYGAVGSKLINTVDICLNCSPIIEEDFEGLKPNTIYILKNRGVRCDVKQSNR